MPVPIPTSLHLSIRVLFSRIQGVYVELEPQISTKPDHHSTSKSAAGVPVQQGPLQQRACQERINVECNSHTVDVNAENISLSEALEPNYSELVCWEHGCNGRIFTTRSNLVRHQREKLGINAKYLCPRCKAAFSRKTARDQHIVRKSCNRIRRYSNGRQRYKV